MERKRILEKKSFFHFFFFFALLWGENLSTQAKVYTIAREICTASSNYKNVVMKICRPCDTKAEFELLSSVVVSLDCGLHSIGSIGEWTFSK